ncbi:MAG: hypothetical protein SH857_00410 [Chitinophagales bacterium]|nr:hypothetical protein [Chitinophagales bacterium]
MIQITILTSDGITAVRIAEFLVEENLVLNAKLLEKVQQYSKPETDVILENRFMLIALTKGLLFPEIEKRLEIEFAKSEIELHAVPIVYMDWQQAERLVTNIEKV